MESSEKPTRWWSRWQPLLVLLVYATLTVVMTWPIAGRLGSHVPGRDGDVWVHLWTFRWIRDAILSWKNPYYTNLLFYPEGTTLYSHNIAWVNIAAWLPLQALFGEGAAYSLVFLAAFIFNGFASYLLIRELTGSSLAGFVGGLIVAFWPYTLSHQDHPNLILIAWIPLALLALKLFFDGRRKRDLILAAIFIALIGLTRWQLLMIGGVIIGLYVLYRIFSDKLYRTPYSLGLILVVVLLAGLIMLPFLLPIFTALADRTVPSDLFVEVAPYSTDLLSYLTPSRYHPLWGDAVSDIYARFPVQTTVPFLGYTTLLLAIIGVVARWHDARIWLIAALLYFLLAIGPDLYLNGRFVDVPMPASLLADTFILEIVRRPIRFNVALSIPLAILAGYGIVSLRERNWVEWRSTTLVAILIISILAEYIVSYRTFPLETPRWYSDLAQQPEEFGTLNIPMNPGQRYYKFYMHYQSVHGKPLVQGHISRIPPEANDFISQNLLLRKVRFEEMEVLSDEFVSVSEQIQPLAEANIRYVILHKDFLPPEELSAWQQWLGYLPYHEDAELAVYRTDPELGRDFQLAHELTVAPNGKPEMTLTRTTITPTVILQNGTVNLGVNWYAGSDVGRDYEICLSLIDEMGQQGGSQCESLAPTWPTSNWQAGELLFTKHAIDLSPYLPQGVYQLSVSLVDSETGDMVGRPATVGELVYDAIPRTFTALEPQVGTNYTWDDAISLLGYDLSFPDPDSLAIIPYWRALRRMDASYTNYFHLINPETGQIAAQADVLPRGWTYPTDWWESGEVVEDKVVLPLEEVSPGEYDLYVGWYDINTGQRLPVYSETGESVPEDSVFLTTIKR